MVYMNMLAVPLTAPLLHAVCLIPREDRRRVTYGRAHSREEAVDILREDSIDDACEVEERKHGLRLLRLGRLRQSKQN